MPPSPAALPRRTHHSMSRTLLSNMDCTGGSCLRLVLLWMVLGFTCGCCNSCVAQGIWHCTSTGTRL